MIFKLNYFLTCSKSLEISNKIQFIQKELKSKRKQEQIIYTQIQCYNLVFRSLTKLFGAISEEREEAKERKKLQLIQSFMENSSPLRI